MHESIVGGEMARPGVASIRHGNFESRQAISHVAALEQPARVA
jgi:hypothetical protein